ncbi:alkaline phosphatase family protein [Pyrococcus sp. ST04]|uniref:alkaline phosphatase family protein n=1 Tax=Pyrococcus sp. ST04 TaxID=1183377 RepID=UPI0002605AA0|nr:alkaline phosphatase family protein [Pyrococcus sp. ST04]AFK22097.1 putative Type I phosphodiesterase / nucleotide pyrophosphatase superfamily [Pyrococcus sp. ST04]
MVSKPHGGKLIRRIVVERTRERILSERHEYPSVQIDHGRAIDLENIAHGVYSPLKGFLTSDDFQSVLDNMQPRIKNLKVRQVNPALEGKHYPSASLVVSEYFGIWNAWSALGAMGDMSKRALEVPRVEELLKAEGLSREDTLRLIELIDSNYIVMDRKAVEEALHVLLGHEPKELLEYEPWVRKVEATKETIEEAISSVEERNGFAIVEFESPFNIISKVARKLVWEKGYRGAVVVNHNFHGKAQLYFRVSPKETDRISVPTIIKKLRDHGIKAMKGAFAINQWLIEEGLLKVENPPREGPVRLDKVKVKWNETIAWAWGGYYSRVFINVKGREPHGVVPPEKFQEVRDEVAELIKSIRGPNGEKWDTKVFYPEEIYPVAKGDKPDMIVYLDDLNWRAAGTLGYETPYLQENDTGPDDAVHAEYGVFSLYLPGMDEAKRIQLTIYDFAPTVLKLFGMRKPLRGRSIV